MKWGKFVSLLLTVVMAISITACGSASPAASQSQSQSDNKAETEATKEAEQSSEQSTEQAEDITIVYWAQWSETENGVPILKDAIARFEEKNPGVKVEVNWAGREVRDILKSSIDSGIQIDIVESGFGQITALGEDYLQDLTPYVAGSEFEKNVQDGMVSFSKSFTSDGKSWIYIPARPFVGAIYYNKTIFDQAGITEMPKTWDEFLDCCQKIKDAGFDPITTDTAYHQSLYGHYLGMLKDTEWLDKLMTEKDPAIWDDPAILQMAQDFAELREKGYFADTVGSNVFPTAQNGEFALGTAAMYYNGSWVVNEIAENIADDFEWGCMFFPAPEGSVYPYSTYTTGCQFYGVTKLCKNPELATKLLMEFAALETQNALAETVNAMPVIKGVTLPEGLAFVGKLMEESTDAFAWGGNLTEDADVRAIVNDAFTALVSGTITPEEFVQSIKDKLQ